MKALQRHSTVLLISVACALLIGAACPAPNHNSFIAVQGDPLTSSAAMDVVKNAGFKWIRLQIPWREVQTGCNPRTYNNWADVDARLTAAASRGLSILATSRGVPACENGNRNHTVPPTDNNAYYYFYRALLDHQVSTLGNLRVGEIVAAFDVWNEPNLTDFWGGNATSYKNKILDPAIRAIKDARAQAGYSPALIVAPSTYSNLSKGQAVDIGQWVSGYAADIDVISVHTYGTRNDQLTEIDDANAWCNSNLNCGQFWVTEGGFSTSGCSQNQCDPLPGDALLATQNRCINRIWCLKNFIFNLHDIPGEGDSGLVNIVNGQTLVRKRLCTLEQGYGAPLVVAAPCPCAAGTPGCD